MRFLPKVILVVFGLTLIVFSGYQNVYSMESAGVILEPSFLEVKAQAGQSATVFFDITNQNSEDIFVNISHANGEILNNRSIGIKNEDISEEPSSWFELAEAPQIIKAGQKSRLQSKLIIPEDTKAGTYFPLILFEIQNISEKDTLSTTGRIGATMFLSVSDLSEENLASDVSLINYNVSPSFSFFPSVKINFTLENKGNLYTKPVGYIEIYDPENNRQVDTFNINENFTYLFTEHKHEREYTWSDTTIKNKFLPPIGEYRIIINYKSLESEEYKTETKSFKVLPIQYIIYILLLVGILAIGAYNVSKKSR